MNFSGNCRINDVKKISDRLCIGKIKVTSKNKDAFSTTYIRAKFVTDSIPSVIEIKDNDKVNAQGFITSETYEKDGKNYNQLAFVCTRIEPLESTVTNE